MSTTLINKTILVTKSRDDAEKSLLGLIEHRAEIIYFPTIKIISRIDTDEIKDMLSRSYQFDYVIFTSANAAEVFHKTVEKYKLDFAHCKVAAIGNSTMERCRRHGFNIHIIPQEFSAKGLIKKFSEFDITNKKILIPCSSRSNEDLSLGLTDLGAEVVSIPIYDIVVNDTDELKYELEKLSQHKPDIFIFTSPSSFENFLRLLNVEEVVAFFHKKIICSIGSTTEQAIRDYGLVVHIVPKFFSLHGVAEAIIKYFQITANIA